MTQSVIQVGNSLGVTLPKEFVKKNKITKNSKVSVSHTNGSIIYSTHTPNPTQYEAITDRAFYNLVKEVESRYGEALEELAKLQ